MTMSSHTVNEFVMALIGPWVFMSYSLYYLPLTILRLVRSRDLTTLTSWPKLQQAWFGDFWAWAGPQVRQRGEARVVPLLQGRVRGGVVLDEGEEAAAPPVSGTVIEVGPGSGMWVSIFSPEKLALKSRTASEAQKGMQETEDRALRHRKLVADESITRVFGVEPNKDVHGELRERITAAGLDGIYEVVPEGIEDLAKSGCVEKAKVDCIVCILCLCGIPEPQRNIRELYQYLKPGGRMYVYEHIRASRHWAMVLYQGERSYYPRLPVSFG